VDEKTAEAADDGITKNVMLHTIDAAMTKIFRRPVRSEALPPMREAATMTADWVSAAPQCLAGGLPTCSPVIPGRQLPPLPWRR
jgi:hypothetical protein